MDTCNCHTLRKDVLEDGIELRQDPTSLDFELHLGNGAPRRSIRILMGDSNGQRKPLCRDSHLIRCQPLPKRSSWPRLVLPEPEWRGITIRVMASQLDFDIQPFARELNLNPGGEGQEPLAQRGAHRDRQKDQLFCLGDGDQLFVVDQKAAVMLVTCQHGIAVMRPAQKPELVDYLTAYGVSSRQRSAIWWAKHTLITLGAEPAAALDEALTRLAVN